MKKTTVQKKKLAIFDIDGTIFRSSLIIEFVKGLIEYGVFPARAENEIKKEFDAWLKRKGPYDNYVGKVVDVYDKYIPGVSKKRADIVVRSMLKKEREKVYRFTRDLVEDLRARGFYLVTISGSPVYAVTKFAEFMGFHVALGKVQEIKNGKFTKNILMLTHKKKDGLLFRFLNEHHIVPDWKGSVAVGDSEGDIEMLELVGHPIAFNPSSGLARHAKKRGWRIVVERKDVIYDIKDFYFISHR